MTTERAHREFELPATLRGWMSVGEVDDGRFFADDLFRRKYGSDAPDYGRHILAFYRAADGALHPVSYLHFWQQARIGLIGGGCTDGSVMRRMPAAQAEAINAAGGLLRQTLLYAFSRFCDDIDAFFGHAGDARAREVDLAAGFETTGHEYLLIRPVGSLTDEQREAMTQQALALGTF